MQNVAIAYSPRGFSNESRVILVPRSKLKETKSLIENDVNAFVFTGNTARRIKVQWKRDVQNGCYFEMELNFH